MALRSIFLTAAVLVTAGFGPPAQGTKAKTPGAILQRWVQLVETHRPGERDVAAIEIASLPPAERAPLIAQVQKFIVLFRSPVPSGTDPEVAFAQTLASGVARRMTGNVFLHRAAVLHGDAMMLAGDLTIPSPPERRRTGSGYTTAPAAELLEANDGELKSTAQRNWNLEFGRTLLDHVDPSPEADEFAGAWYHATAAFLLSKNWLGELRPHIERGDRVRPYDPRILFDLGVLFEAFSLSRVQTLVRTVRLGPGLRPDVPSLAESENQAIGYFRRVVELTPDHVEARVRLGRLLAEHQQYDNAIVHFTRAIKETKDPYLLYHAHLFAARAEEGRGNDADAVAHCREAVRLFPRAQSAHIALSLAELRLGDLPAAIAPIDTIRALPVDFTRDDPWWSYQAGAGRDADAILAALWKRLQ